MCKYNFFIAGTIMLFFMISCQKEDPNTNDTDSTVFVNNVTLGAQKNNMLGGFYSDSAKASYSLNEAYYKQETVDLVYYFENDDKNTIACPAANINDTIFVGTSELANWNIKNETKFYKSTLSGINYNNIMYIEELESAFNEAETTLKATNLTEDDIYAFKMSSGKYGLFYVKSVIANTEGSLIIEIKTAK